jgi:hypothetical protein
VTTFGWGDLLREFWHRVRSAVLQPRPRADAPPLPTVAEALEEAERVRKELIDDERTADLAYDRTLDLTNQGKRRPPPWIG